MSTADVRHAASRGVRGGSALLAATLLALLLRVYALGEPHLEMDELSTVLFARESWERLLGVYALDVHPPLTYALQKLWNVFGEQPATMRWLPALLGAACVPLTFLLVRTLTSARAAWIAAFLIATSPMHVMQSRQLRMYPLLNAACLVAMLGLAVSLRSGRRRRGLATFVVGAVVAFYAHNTALFMIACSGALVVALWRAGCAQRRDLFATTAALALVGLLIAPWLPILQNHVTHTLDDGWIAAATGAFAYSQLLGCYPVWWAFKIPLYALVAAGLFASWPYRKAWLFCVAFGIGVPAATWVASLLRPVFVTRSLAWVSSLWLVLAAVALARIPWRRLRVAAVVIVALMHVHALRGEYRAQPGATAFSPLAVDLRAACADGDVVLLATPTLENWVRYELPDLFPEAGAGEATPRVVTVLRGPAPFAGTLLRAESLALSELGERLAAYDRVWLLEHTGAFATGDEVSELAVRARRRGYAREVDSFRLCRYDR